MPATPPLWADVAADLGDAIAEVGRAAAKAADLATLSAAAREDRELAIGKHLHDAYSAGEKALERLIEAVDQDLPRGASFHRDLLERAARPLPGVREAIITADTLAKLRRLLSFRHVFRHAYGDFDYELAAPNVAIAATVIPRLVAEATAFARAAGITPP